MPIRVLIADDHELVRMGLRAMFADADIEVVGEATTDQDTIEKTITLKPDVVLIDFSMPIVDGMTALHELRQRSPDVHVIMHSHYDNPSYVARAIAGGAKDFLHKNCTRSEIVDAIHRAVAGDGPAESGVFLAIKINLARRETMEGIPLTRRELQVVRHIAYGLSNKDIGQSLRISVETVKEHVQSILRKLDFQDRTQVGVWAVRKGLS